MRTFLSRFTRITTTGRLIPEIDGLRFVAITMVIITHIAAIYEVKGYPGTPPVASHYFKLGSEGVQLFFMISGFILAMPFVEHFALGMKPVRLGAFYMRRVTRLEPPYVISMLIFFLGGLATGKFTMHEHLRNLLWSLVYMHNIVFNKGSLINNNAWSLEIEVQFYLLVPLLTQVFRLRAGVRRTIFVVAMAIGSWLSVQIGTEIPRTIFSYWQFFLGGFLLADLYSLGRWSASSKSFWYDAVGAAAIVAFLLMPGGASAFLLPLVFGVFGMATFRGILLRRLLTTPLLVALGGMCYSVYLLHARVISIAIDRLLGGSIHTGCYSVDMAGLLLILLPAVFLCSAVFFVFVERPCMRKDWPRRAWNSVSNVIYRRPVGT